MQNSLPTTFDLSSTLAALLKNTEFQEGIEHGHIAFFDEYESGGDPWTVDELTSIADETALNSANMEKTIVHAYLLDKWVDGGGLCQVRIDWNEVAANRERLGQGMFYYGLGFLLGFIDQGLRPTES